jgi:hypothetical protein
MILLVHKDGPIKFPIQYEHHFPGRRHTFEFLGPGSWYVFPLHALMFACRFIVMHPLFMTCDKALQENLSFFTVSLQKLHAYFHMCPFVPMCLLLLHPPCTNFVIPKVLVDDGICISTADVQLSYPSDNNLSSQTRTFNLFNIVCYSWSGQMTQAVFPTDACFATLEPFHPLVHLPLHNTLFPTLC